MNAAARAFISYARSDGEAFASGLRRRLQAEHQDFVARPVESEALLSMLLDRAGMNPLVITTALENVGGFGKTTLAAAICHHDDIITAFDDGILWTTLGQRPNVQQELTRLYAALTGDRPTFVDAENASIELAARLEDKHCLIVIDDVWDFQAGEVATGSSVSSRTRSALRRGVTLARGFWPVVDSRMKGGREMDDWTSGKKPRLYIAFGALVTAAIAVAVAYACSGLVSSH